MNTANGISIPETGLRWLFVDMNSFFASCEQQMNPELRGQAVAIAPMLVDSTSAIAAS
jgi:DNA polymerase-4